MEALRTQDGYWQIGTGELGALTGKVHLKPRLDIQSNPDIGAAISAAEQIQPPSLRIAICWRGLVNEICSNISVHEWIICRHGYQVESSSR